MRWQWNQCDSTPFALFLSHLFCLWFFNFLCFCRENTVSIQVLNCVLLILFFWLFSCFVLFFFLSVWFQYLNVFWIEKKNPFLFYLSRLQFQKIIFLPCIWSFVCTCRIGIEGTVDLDQSNLCRERFGFFRHFLSAGSFYVWFFLFLILCGFFPKKQINLINLDL